MLEESLRIPKKAIDLLFGIKENNVISTNPFVLLLMHFAYYPVRIFKPLHVKKIFLLQAYFLQISLKFTWANNNWQYLKIAMKQEGA